MFSLKIATPSERQRLGSLRAGAWREGLTEKQFLDRNERLYQHEYGKNHITTYLLKDSHDSICASMDVLDINLLVKVSSGLEMKKGHLIASVITAPADRKKGYASMLLKLYLEKNSPTSGVLYSDIGPPFYERFGYHAKLMRLREMPGITSSLPFRSIPFEEGVKRLVESRRVLMEKAPSQSGALLPEALFLDWHLERYRYFAELMTRQLPPAVFYETHLLETVGKATKSHLLFAVPNYCSDQLEVLWVEQGCKECYQAASALAPQLGVATVAWWDEALESSSGKTECPMIRLGPDSPHAQFIDPQWADWW